MPMTPIALLPWLSLQSEIRMGRVLFWPYEQNKHNLLPDQGLLHQLDKYAAVFRLSDGQPAPVTCVSYRRIRTGSYNITESRELVSARHALFASAYIQGIENPLSENLGWYLPSADHFAAIPLPPKEGIVKGVFGIEHPRLHSIGMVDNFRVSMPDHIHMWKPRFFEPLLTACSVCLSPRHQARSEYVRRALEWFFCSHSTHDMFSDESRLVLLCMAIEAAIGSAEGRKEFSEKVRQATAMTGLPRRLHWIKEIKKRVTCNRLDVWAWDFYEARNAFVHPKGRRPSLVWRRFGVVAPHDFIAAYVWLECLWKTLEDLSIVPPEPRCQGTQLAQMKPCWAWYHKWRGPLDRLREPWREYLSGKIEDSPYGIG